jgi:glycosyltransferase involved in cell wall biosynthesis
VQILHVVDHLGGRGGAEEHLRGILEELGAAGHMVHLAAGHVTGPDPWHGVDRVPGLEAREARPVDVGPVSDSFRPDVIHLHNIMNPEVLEWAASTGLPAVATVQDHRFFCPGQGKWTASGTPCTERMTRDVCAGCLEDARYLDRMYELTARRLAAIGAIEVLVLSQYMKRELVEAGLRPSRVHVIPPFVHGLDRDMQADGPPCVGFVGRLTRAKGVDDAIEAWRLSGVDLPLIFAGTGPERSRLEGSGFEVLGWLPRHALGRFYRRAAAVVMPSRWQEPFGIVGIEALSLGTPVAAWDSGGIAEWHGGGGLAAWGDTKGLAQALRRATLEGRRPPDDRFGPDEPMRRLVALYNSMRARALGGAPLG